MDALVPPDVKPDIKPDVKPLGDDNMEEASLHASQKEANGSSLTNIRSQTHQAT